jgi:hypothetical protein
MRIYLRSGFVELRWLHKPTETIIISVATLAGAALGMTSAEKIFKK